VICLGEAVVTIVFLVDVSAWLGHYQGLYAK
jgi:hypothetical protein